MQVILGQQLSPSGSWKQCLEVSVKVLSRQDNRLHRGRAMTFGGVGFETFPSSPSSDGTAAKRVSSLKHEQ